MRDVRARRREAGGARRPGRGGGVARTDSPVPAAAPPSETDVLRLQILEEMKAESAALVDVQQALRGRDSRPPSRASSRPGSRMSARPSSRGGGDGVGGARLSRTAALTAAATDAADADEAAAARREKRRAARRAPGSYTHMTRAPLYSG